MTIDPQLVSYNPPILLNDKANNKQATPPSTPQKVANYAVNTAVSTIETAAQIPANPQLQLLASKITNPQTTPQKIASYTFDTAIQIPKNFCQIYASLYVMGKTYQATAATLNLIGSGVIDVLGDARYALNGAYNMLGDAYCAVATCVPNPIEAVVEMAVNTNPVNSSDTADATVPASEDGVLNNMRQMTRGDIAMLGATRTVIEPVVSYCFKELLGCNQDTPWRNHTATVATSVTTTVLSSYATNMLGFQTNTAGLVKMNLIGLALSPVINYATKRLQESMANENKIHAGLQEDEIEIPAPTTNENAPLEIRGSISTRVANPVDLVEGPIFLDPSRVKQLPQFTFAAKADLIGQISFQT